MFIQGCKYSFFLFFHDTKSKLFELLGTKKAANGIFAAF
jgi:hypothetical protein